jgi:transposase-like protein
VALPESEGHTQIMVVVDCFSKVTHFIALKETSSTKDAANAFLKEVWKLHGLPESIVSDCDKKWTSEFWDGPCGLLGINKRMSTSFSPQMDRQTERVDQTLETYLYTFINYD